MKQYFFSALIFKSGAAFTQPYASKSGIIVNLSALEAMREVTEEANKEHGECTVHFTAFNEVN